MSITQYICIPCKKVREICWKLRGKRNVCTLACLALTCVSLCSAGSHCKGTSHKSIRVARTVVFPPMTASFIGLRIISVVDLSQILQGGDTCRKSAPGNPDLHPLFFHYDFFHSSGASTHLHVFLRACRVPYKHARIRSALLAALHV